MLDYIEDEALDCILVDASGVLYTKTSVVDNATEVFLQAYGRSKKIFVVTNNSTLSVSDILKKLRNFGFSIELDQIISSGMGLTLDPHLKKLVSGKKCYCVGWDSSLHYMATSGASIVEQLEEADVVVCLSSFFEGNDKVFGDLGAYLRNNPQIPIICTNPDKYIRTNDSLYQVVGYHVEKMASEFGLQIQWFGKPYENFSKMVGKILGDKGITIGKNVRFFDDNYENVASMVDHLGIQGTCVVQTGLSRDIDFSKEGDLHPSVNFIDRFTL